MTRAIDSIAADPKGSRIFTVFNKHCTRHRANNKLLRRRFHCVRRRALLFATEAPKSGLLTLASFHSFTLRQEP